MGLREDSMQKDAGGFEHNSSVESIIKKMHNPSGRIPRLEIPGWGELRRETLFMDPFSGLVQNFNQMSDDKKKELPAIYILNYGIEDTSYITDYRWEYLLLPQSALRELANNTIRASDAELLRIYTLGKKVSRYDRWDDYAGVHDGDGVKSHDVKVALCYKKDSEDQGHKFYVEIIEDQEK